MAGRAFFYTGGGVLLAAALALYLTGTPLGIGLLFAALLFLPAWEDWHTGYISDRHSLLLAAGGAVHWLCFGTMTDLLGAAGAAALFLLLSRYDAAGAGDIYLAGAAALWLTWQECILFLWGAFAIGGLIGAWLVLTGKKALSDSLPFAPCLCLSGGWSYACGSEVWAWLFP